MFWVRGLPFRGSIEVLYVVAHGCIGFCSALTVSCSGLFSRGPQSKIEGIAL